MASITEVITYYAEFEPIYLQGQSKTVSNLKNTIIHVYSEILKFLSLVAKYYQDRGKGVIGLNRPSPLSIEPATVYISLTIPV